MQFGHFDDQMKEYVIHQPDTPLPWINYLGSEDYFGIISNTAGGYSFYRDARLRRITRYRYNNVPFDFGGRYIYLRDRSNGEFWSPTWQPVRKPLEEYSCRHGMGYTIIHSTYQQISAQIRYFVPLGQTLEVWDLTLENHRESAVQLSVFSSIEFALWDALDDSSNFQRNFSTGEVEIERDVIFHKTEYRERRNHFSYFACSEPLTGFDTQRESFLGAYRGWEDPWVVEHGESNGSVAHGWAPIGSHHITINLAPGETHRVIFVLGYHENLGEEKFDPPGSQKINKRTVFPVIDHYLQPEVVDHVFEELGSHWGQLLSILHVQTPDVHTDRMVNIWNAYQCMVTFNMSRSASFYESGIGRGLGFRDSNQDLLGFVHMVPERARQRILDLAATQLESGGAYHQYQPLTKRGNNAVGSNFNDDPLWLIIGVAAYIKETGDWRILDESIPYDNQPGSEKPLFEHLQRCIQYTLDRLGPHQLPLIGRADWNDCLNLNAFLEEPGETFQTAGNQEGKVAESIFIAGLFVLAAHEMAEIANHRGLGAESVEFIRSAERLENTIKSHGWDGDWFLRAYDHFGQKIGSHECEEGKIFVESQGICVLAGIGLEDGRAAQAMDSVRENLATPHGILLQQPAFSHYYLNLGEISSYPPGYKENAGIFCHTNPWIMIAETRLGHGDLAHDYYSRTNPSVREVISEIHRCEPYVYAQMIAGRDAPSFGEAKNSWLTGTAAWNYVAITQWILGIRPEYDGLIVDPVVPRHWSGFKARREFRGCIFNITVERSGEGNQITLDVNGIRQEGNLVPLSACAQGEVSVNLVIS